ncbi:hypothetical protein GCM10027435_16910 [Haloparvum alkalitolerans]|uniref:hypothetical protein n=1 Tax=Haloparvum alkalitolerans TaxID=1042953 RepID=UPI003CF3E7C7
MSSETERGTGEEADRGREADPEGDRARETADANALREDGRDAGRDAGVAAPTATDGPEADGFGRAGWVLTATLLVCVLVIPGIIYVYPYVLGSFGLTFFGTYLALPLVPAVLLGLVAVWSMSAAVSEE